MPSMYSATSRAPPLKQAHPRTSGCQALPGRLGQSVLALAAVLAVLGGSFLGCVLYALFLGFVAAGQLGYDLGQRLKSRARVVN